MEFVIAFHDLYSNFKFVRFYPPVPAELSFSPLHLNAEDTGALVYTEPLNV